MLAGVFGYFLEFIYNLVNNYGLAIIIFSIILKLILLPISIKQQRTMKKTEKIQRDMKEIQDKYSNDPQKMNQEVMDLYKREKMSPFSGCLSAIIQIVLLFSMFYLVQSPLTYMKRIPTETIDKYKNEIKMENEANLNSTYPEISIIKLKAEEHPEVAINMDFLGIDLSNVPTQAGGDIKAYIIPVLYVISSFVSIRITTNMQKSKKNENNGEKDEKSELDAVKDANKMMSYMMPLLSISIAIIAPLGLALYWLVNNVLMIIERICLNKFLKEEEAE